jgi:hypothetical protein
LGFSIFKLTAWVGARVFRLRALSDLQTHSDKDGTGDRAGISSSHWSPFGHRPSRRFPERMAPGHLAEPA